MSDNNANSSENKNNYNKDIQDRYKEKCMQIAIRYGVNENEMTVRNAIEKYCVVNNCSRGNFTRNAILEKLQRDGFLE